MSDLGDAATTQIRAAWGDLLAMTALESDTRRVFVDPKSALGPAGWVGILALDRAVLVAVPTPDLEPIPPGFVPNIYDVERSQGQPWNYLLRPHMPGEIYMTSRGKESIIIAGLVSKFAPCAQSTFGLTWEDFPASNLHSFWPTRPSPSLPCEGSQRGPSPRRTWSPCEE